MAININGMGYVSRLNGATLGQMDFLPGWEENKWTYMAAGGAALVVLMALMAKKKRKRKKPASAPARRPGSFSVQYSG